MIQKKTNPQVTIIKKIFAIFLFKSVKTLTPTYSTIIKALINHFSCHFLVFFNVPLTINLFVLSSYLFKSFCYFITNITTFYFTKLINSTNLGFHYCYLLIKNLNLSLYLFPRGNE